MKKEYHISGLHCASCALKVENRIKNLPGIQNVSMDFEKQKLRIDYLETELFDLVKKQIIDIEPSIEIQPDVKEEHYDHCHEDGCCAHTDHEERKVTGAHKLYIRGLDCAGCAAKIETVVSKMENVKEASLNFSTGVLYVDVEKETQVSQTLQKIIEIVPTLEDGVIVEMEKSKAHKQPSAFAFSVNWKLYVGGLLFIAGLLLEDTPYGLILFVIAYLFAGGRVVYTALRNIMRKEIFDENFLMSVATIGAFAVESYKEAVAVMLFYEIGEMFQSFAVQRSRASISSLMDIRADYANVLENGNIVRKAAEEVAVDAIVLVKPGERVPLDGVLIKGDSTFDTSALTGESMPREALENDTLLSGFVNLNSVIQMRVTKPFAESTLSRILELVENASAKKAPMEKFITRFAKVYTPIVVGLALLLVVLPMIIIPNADFYDWLYRALTFLVVSCPCALVVSIPLGLFAGIGAAGRHGILVKGGNYLEALQNVDTVVFDKTGTLTKGVFHVVEIHAVQGNKDALLEFAAYGEYYSNHPIATSIKEAYGNDIDQNKIFDYREIAGHGVEVRYKNHQLALGNHVLMRRNNIKYVQSDALGTIIHVAIDQEYAGYIVINDEIKETSKAAIMHLKAAGVKKTVMLSGDRKAVGESVGNILGIDEVHMQLLPNDKVEIVETLLKQQSGKAKLAFVGDGMNDAPVLARADIGVAMGGIGSDAAIEAADVVLMKDDPVALYDAIQIARKTMKILKQNIVLSLGIKIIILLLTAIGLTNMWTGVFADVGVTLIAILNSMRALRI